MEVSMADSYHSERDTQNILQLREILKDFPPFAKQYFLAQEASKESRTRLSYAYDIRTFFRYLQENNPVLRDRDIRTWDVSVLDDLTATDIDEYKSFLSVYKVNESLLGAPRENSFTNNEFGLKRKVKNFGLKCCV